MPTGFPDYYGGLTLPVTVQEGGTGLTTADQHALLLGNDTGTMRVLDPGTSGYVLTSNGVSADPSWQAPSVDASNFTGILAVAHGGTGTASPTLLAGTGISISGSWPDQTIANSSAYAALADPLPIAHGGTGTASPALVAGTGISISGSWPDQTIANSSAYAALADPLPIAHGGTGSSSPALVAGSNISITGSWPGQTVALDSAISLATINLTPTGNVYALQLHHNETSGQAATIEFHDDGNNSTRGYLGVVQSVGDFVTAASAGDIFLRADTGSIWLAHNSTWALKMDSSGNVTLAESLTVGTTIYLPNSAQINGIAGPSVSIYKTLYLDGPGSGGTGGVTLGSTTASSATTGSETLPANPAGFWEINIAGTTYKIPYYNN